MLQDSHVLPTFATTLDPKLVRKQYEITNQLQGPNIGRDPEMETWLCARRRPKLRRGERAEGSLNRHP